MNVIFVAVCIFFVSCFLVPSTAYAYLDPGTGNALVYVLLSLLGAVFYFLKGVFYRFISKKDFNNKENAIRNERTKDNSIVIFSEGKAYWTTYKPLIEKLIEKGKPFSYYTMDRHDPCLTIDNLLMDNRYIGDGNVAYAKMGHLSADIVITTTPNIGTKGYPIPRSKRINNLVYTFHGFSDLSFLHRGSLDHYDTVMLMGEFEIALIRKLEQLRGLPAKVLVPGGILYMDELLKNSMINPVESTGTYIKSKVFTTDDIKRVTVLLAPSYGVKGFLSYYDIGFVEKLALQGFNLIFRPHPQSFKEDYKMLLKIKERLSRYEKIIWDVNPDATDSFKQADILISDTSGIKIDFAFVYHKPFIALPVPLDNLEDFEIADLGGSWAEEAIQEIGYTLKENEIYNLDEVILKVLNEKTDIVIENFRKKHVYNWGNAGEVIADYLINTNSIIQNEMKRESI